MLLNKFGRENGRTLRARLHHPYVEQELWRMGIDLRRSHHRNRGTPQGRPDPSTRSTTRQLWLITSALTGPTSMSFLRHERSIGPMGSRPQVRGKAVLHLLPASHPHDESQPPIPRQVALPQSPPPLQRPLHLAPSGRIRKPGPPESGLLSTGILSHFQRSWHMDIENSANRE